MVLSLAALRIDGFSFGFELVYSTNCGKCFLRNMTTPSVLTGTGYQWMAPWSRRHSEEKGPAPTQPTGEKKGTKRSILTDANGIPLAREVAGANIHDMKLVEATLENIVAFRPIPTPEREQNLCQDKGYDYQCINTLVRRYGFTPHIRHRGEDAVAYRHPEQPARRWVVERTNSWMNRFRRILIRWEKKLENYVAMLDFAFAVIVFDKLKYQNCLLG